MSEHSPSAETPARPGRDAIVILVIAVAHLVVFGVLAARSERGRQEMTEHRERFHAPTHRDPTPAPFRKFQPELIS